MTACRLLLCSDKGSMFRWETSLCRQEAKRQGVPTSPRTTAVSQQLLLFSNHSLLAAWLIIHLLRATQQAFMYITFALFISWASGLPPHFHVPPASQAESSRHHHMIPGSPSFAARVVYSSHSALLLSIIIKQNQMIPHIVQLDLSFLYLPPTSSLLIFLCLSHVNVFAATYDPFMLKMVALKQRLYYSLRGCLLCHNTVINCSKSLRLQWYRP